MWKFLLNGDIESRMSENWVIHYMVKLYKSKSVDRISKNRLNAYRERVKVRIKIFEVLAGERDLNSLGRRDVERFRFLIDHY